MRTKIWPILSSALLLSACGAKVVGEDLPACESMALEDFDLPQALGGLEVRSNSGDSASADSARSVQVIGDSCASTSCSAEVAEVDAQQLGWPINHPGQAPFIEYVIGMTDGSLVGSATSDAELLQLIGPIDTLAEAQLVAELNSLGCVRAGEQDGSFQVVSREVIESCPVTTQEVLYRIDADASVHELDRGDQEHDKNVCIGRRPAGLAQRRAVGESSGLGDFLARSAELEAASVVAFRVLEAELRAHGAPQALLDRVADAASDEVLHARLVSHLAERFGGRVTPRSIRVAKVRDLETVALENALEGCVAETWGCLLGMHQAQHAKSLLLRLAYRRIASDEARHAQLSWDIADWADAALDAAARERIAGCRAQAVHELASTVSHEPESAAMRATLGLPDLATRRRLFAHLKDVLWS